MICWMKKTKYLLAQFNIAKQLLSWLLLILPVAISIGLLVALFLWLLDLATATRWQNRWLIFLLPLAGIFISWLYSSFGKNSDDGSNLIWTKFISPEVACPPG